MIYDRLFPILSWPVTLDGTLSVTVDGTTESIVLDATVDGFGASAYSSFTWTAPTTSLAGYLASRLLTHSKITAVSTVYLTGERAFAQYRITCTTSPANEDVTIAGPEDLMRSLGFGFNVSGGTMTATFLAITGVLSNANFAGIWSVPGSGADIDPRREEIVGVEESAFSSTGQETMHLGTKNRLIITWPEVLPRWISRWRAQQQQWADQVSCSDVDPHGTLDSVLESMARNDDVDVWYTPGDVNAVESGRWVVVQNPSTDQLAFSSDEHLSWSVVIGVRY